MYLRRADGKETRLETEALVRGSADKDPILQPGDALQALLADVVPDAPPDGGEGVLAEVVAVAVVDGVQEQADLEGLEVRGSAGGGMGGPGRVRPYRYSHTRSRVSSE